MIYEFFRRKYLITLKDLDEQHNLVTAYLLQGYPLQVAFEKSGDLLQSRYRDWYRNFATLPFWEEHIDRQVQLYLSGVQNVALANLNWRFVVLRFLYFPFVLTK